MPDVDRWARHADLIVPKDLRADAMWIARRNLHGDQWQLAYRFLSNPHRTRSDIESFISRMKAGGAS